MRIVNVHRSSALGRLGQPVPEPSAVSAIVSDLYGRPYPGIVVKAVHRETRQTIATGTTDQQGRTSIRVPASGIQVELVPAVGFFMKSVPENGVVTSLPISAGGVKDVVRSNWGWSDSVKFTVAPRSYEDYLTTETLIVAGVAGLAIWYFFFRKD